MSNKSNTVDVTAIIDAAKDRASGWIAEYRAHAAHRSTPAKVAEALSASDYLLITGAKSISESTVRTYRTAWALASAFPEVAAHVGNGGQIHTTLSYALATKGVGQEDINAFIKSTIEEVNKAADKEDTLRLYLKEFRALCKSYRDAEKSSVIEETVNSEEVAEIAETHPQEIADAALLAMMNAARDYVAAIADGASKDAANLMELSRILSPLSSKKAAA